MQDDPSPAQGASTALNPGLEGAYRKAAWRLLPFLLIAYGLAYLDRINIAFAQVEMSHDLGFTNAMYGLGAGIFFIGYMIFEIPCNFIITRIGVRRTIGSIMVVWGALCCAMAFMQDATTFYVLRFLLGVAEAGFAPAMILYVSRWFPARHQGRVMGLLMSGPFVAAIVGGPASGLIMKHADGLWGMHGWQWMFFSEGLLPAVLGVLALLLLTETPAEARWLNDRERVAIMADKASEAPAARKEGRFWDSFRNPFVLYLALAYFCLAFAGYGITFWMPMLIEGAGVSDIGVVGYLTALPAVAAVISMNAFGHFSDRTGRRALYIVGGALLSALGLLLVPLAAGNLLFVMFALCLGKAAMNASNAMLWTLPNTHLRGAEAAGGVAIIVTVGVLGGFLSPIMIGSLRDLTGGFDQAFILTAAITMVAALFVPLALRAARARVASQGTQ